MKIPEEEKWLLIIIILGGGIIFVIILALGFIFFGVNGYRTIAVDTPISNTPISSNPGTADLPKKCIVGGCNNELCYDATEPAKSSACIYKEEFSCFKEEFAKCEVQKDENCDWTDNPDLSQCLLSSNFMDE